MQMSKKDVVFAKDVYIGIRKFYCVANVAHRWLLVTRSRLRIQICTCILTKGVI